MSYANDPRQPFLPKGGNRPAWDAAPSGSSFDQSGALRNPGSVNAPAPPKNEMSPGLKWGLCGVGIVGLVCAWVLEGECTQNLQNDAPIGVGPRPFLIAYCARIAWMMLLGGWYVWRSVQRANVPKDVITVPTFLHFSARHYLFWITVLAVGVFACAYTWFISLNDTSVAANTAIYNSSPVAVFLFSIPVLRERPTLKKVVAVLFTVGGVAAVQFLDVSSVAAGELSYLSLSGASLHPPFSPNVTSYTAVLSSAAPELEVDARLTNPDTDQDGTAQLYLNGAAFPVPAGYGHSVAARVHVADVLHNGTGVLNIALAASGSPVYKVTIAPAGSNSTSKAGGLSSLTFSARGPFANFTPAFSTATLRYRAGLIVPSADADKPILLTVLATPESAADLAGVQVKYGNVSAACKPLPKLGAAECTLELPPFTTPQLAATSTAQAQIIVGSKTYTVALESTVGDAPPRKMNLAKGYTFLLISLVLYAIYEVGYKHASHSPKDTSPIASSFFWLGAMGLAAVLLFWPCFFLLDYTGVETFEMPHGAGLRLLIINSCLDMLFNVCLLLVIAVTSPLFASVAQILTIPASILADYLIHDTMLPTPCFIGVGLIAVGVVIMVSEGGH